MGLEKCNSQKELMFSRGVIIKTQSLLRKRTMHWTIRVVIGAVIVIIALSLLYSLGNDVSEMLGL